MNLLNYFVFFFFQKQAQETSKNDLKIEKKEKRRVERENQNVIYLEFIT